MSLNPSYNTLRCSRKRKEVTTPDHSQLQRKLPEVVPLYKSRKRNKNIAQTVKSTFEARECENQKDVYLISRLKWRLDRDCGWPQYLDRWDQGVDVAELIMDHESQKAHLCGTALVELDGALLEFGLFIE